MLWEFNQPSETDWYFEKNYHIGTLNKEASEKMFWCTYHPIRESVNGQNRKTKIWKIHYWNNYTLFTLLRI